MWLPNGCLKIIDRIKHIFKLSQGEYISPEVLLFLLCPSVIYVLRSALFEESREYLFKKLVYCTNICGWKFFKRLVRLDYAIEPTVFFFMFGF
jgi:long-subunit acyl-CoA synthetase (AMP-forming)